MGSKNRTFDGFNLNDVVSLLESIGAKIKDGNSHRYVAVKPGIFPCALGPTTGFKQHVVPWIHKAFPQYSNQQIYQGVQTGYIPR